MHSRLQRNYKMLLQYHLRAAVLDLCQKFHMILTALHLSLQRNYKMLLQYHRAAVLATRDFWRLLLRNSVDLVQVCVME